MSDLFAAASDRDRRKPLAEEARPARLDDIVGQQHLLGSGKLLRRRIDTGRIGTVILYGPPGTGKTTIARAIGKHMKKTFVQLHPATHNTADIRKVADEARVRPVLVFIDELHRYNSAVQDQLLALTEDNVFDLLGATSVNPYHNLTTALVSRSTILELKPHSVDDVERIVTRAAWQMKDDGVLLEFEGGSLQMLAGRAGGDARRALNALEAICAGMEGNVTVTEDMVDEVYQASPIPYDRKGDAAYDITSAFVKSMRGGDADATLYWLARLVHGGEDPRYIARRIMVHASEDVGLADNGALQTAVAALHAVEKIGYPEARIVLAHAALHVCRAPKSNSAYAGIARALDMVQKEPLIEVPSYLRDTHYEGAAPLGRGGYRSPHSSDAGWVEQVYAPGLEQGSLYASDARSSPTFERRADEYWTALTGRKAPARRD